MKIVVLDGYTLNPGDLDWSEISALGDLTVYDRTPIEKVFQRAVGAQIVLTNKTKISAETIEKLQDLKYIGELATGYDNIAIEAAAKRTIPVCNVPGYSTPSVAQMTWALILELTNQVAKRSDEVKDGAWVRSQDFSFGSKGLVEVQDKTLGLIGLGAIGSKVAEIGLAFGMKVKAAVRHPENYHVPGVEITSTINEVFKAADVLSLHLPLNEESFELVDSKRLKIMKNSGFLINTSRGGLINEMDLAEALKKEQIAGAAVDVLSSEPPKADNPLLDAPNCIITPHVAWASKESRQRLVKIAADNIRGFLNGKLQNVVDGNNE